MNDAQHILNSDGGDLSRKDIARKVASSATAYLNELPSCEYRFSHRMFDLEGDPVTNHYVFSHSGDRFILNLLGEDDSVVRITSYDGETYYYLDHDKALFRTTRASDWVDRIANHLYITPVLNPFYRMFLADMSHFIFPDLLQPSAWLGALRKVALKTAKIEKDSVVFGYRHNDLKFDYHFEWTPSRGFPHHYRLLTGSGPNSIDEHWDVLESVKVETSDGGSIEIPSRIASRCTHAADGRFHRASFTIELDEPSMKVFKDPPPGDFFQVPSSMAHKIEDEDLGGNVNSSTD